MGNICGGAGKDRVAEDSRPASPGTTMTSKTSGSLTTSQSTTGKLSSASSFMASAGSRSTSGGFVDEGGKYPDGQILEAPNLRTFTFMELKTATKNFRPDSVLGEGGFGRVYKGWVDEKTMAPTKNGTGRAFRRETIMGSGLRRYAIPQWGFAIMPLRSETQPLKCHLGDFDVFSSHPAPALSLLLFISHRGPTERKG